MKIILAGSPSYVLQAFVQINKHFDVVAIITQPDRNQGRHLLPKQTAVSNYAITNQIKLFKPDKIVNILPELSKVKYDLFLTFAYGQYIPKSVLKTAKLAALNIHGSLLPSHRGGAPVHHAVLNGDSLLGISLITMNQVMDSGDIYFQATQEINQTTTTGQGHEIIGELAAKNIVEWLKKVESGQIKAKKQGDNYTFSPKVQKKDGELLDNMTIKQAERVIRAFNPNPGAFVFLDGKRLKVFDFSLMKVANSVPIALSNGTIYAKDFQFESKKRQQLS